MIDKNVMYCNQEDSSNDSYYHCYHKSNNNIIILIIILIIIIVIIIIIIIISHHHQSSSSSSSVIIISHHLVLKGQLHPPFFSVETTGRSSKVPVLFPPGSSHGCSSRSWEPWLQFIRFTPWNLPICQFGSWNPNFRGENNKCLSCHHLGPRESWFSAKLGVRCISNIRFLSFRVIFAMIMGGRVTWNLKITQLQRKIIFQAWIFRSMLNFRGVKLRLELLPAHIGSVDFPSLGGVISYSFFIIFQHSWCKAPGRPNIGVKMKIYPSDHGNLPDLL